MPNSRFCGGAGDSAVSMTRYRERVPCRRHVSHERVHHRQRDGSEGTPSWRITEGQDGSLCWVTPKTRPFPQVSPTNNATKLTRGVSRRKLSGIPKGPLASIQPPMAATQPAAGFFGATVLQVAWSLVAGG